MNPTRWWVAAVIVVVAAFGWWWVKSHGGDDRPRYRTTAIERGAIEMVVSATGTIEPVEQVDVGSQVSGTVSRLNADYNSRVKKGDLLLQLEPSSYRARAAQAEAAVARADAALEDAQRQYRRAKELVAQKYVSDAEVEAADVAVKQREADLKQARAAHDAAQVDLANTTILSPIDGVVIARSIELGQTVAASLQAPKLFVIANDLSQMQVETRIDEADIGQIRPGLPVIFNVDAFPDQQFEGIVSQVRLEPIVEQNVVTYTTVIRTANHDLKLRPGMTANVTVRVANRDDVLKVPNSALRFRPPVSEKKSGSAEGNGNETSRGQRAAGDVGTSGSASTSATNAAARPGDAQASTDAVVERGAPGGAAAKGGKSAGAAKGAAGKPQAKAADKAKDESDDFGRAEMEQRMRARGMSEDMISSILARRDEWIDKMKSDGLSNDEIREKIRERQEAMRNGGGGGMGGGMGGMGGGFGGAGGASGGTPSFRNFGKSEMSAGAAPAHPQTGPVVMGTVGAPQPKPGTVYVLRNGKPEKVSIMTGITDGGFTEVTGDGLQPGDQVIVGLVLASNARTGTQLPPGMGGGPGGRR